MNKESQPEVIRLSYTPNGVLDYIERWQAHLAKDNPENTDLRAMAEDIHTLVKLAVRSLKNEPEKQPFNK